MITDADIVNLNVGVYKYPDIPPTQWDFFEPGVGTKGVCYGIKRLENTDVVVLRGSDSFLDWRRDFDAWANPFSHSQLGPIHAGFLTGMIETWLDIKGRIGAKAIVSGHSLGAARAAILTGLMVCDGFKPLARVVFGEPNPGFQRLADLILGIPGRSYCNGDNNGHDLVTDTPYFIPPLLRYVHPSPLIHLQATPTEFHISDFGIFGYHHIKLYAQSIKNMVPVGSA
jgi:hypothetical protein